MIRPQNSLIGLILVSIIAAQFWFLCTQELFGDESFYWLESQFLDWSYAELPGWTAWMIRLGTQLFGNNYFAVRIPSFLAYLSIYILIYKFNIKYIQNNSFLNVLLVASIPIYLLLATMALPDIWMVFFVVWMTYFLFRACNQTGNSNWFILGLFMACSINVHIRMWIWLAIAGLSFLFIYKPKAHVLKAFFGISFPIAVLGLVPIMLFNYSNGFPMLQFQLVDRQPWQFQIGNLIFLFSQFIVISPIILLLWFKLVVKQFGINSSDPFIKWIIATALVHFIFYLFMSLFADGLRTTVHWLVISYIPVLALATIGTKNIKLVWFSIASGILTSVFFIFYLSTIDSSAKSRIIDNSTGWSELAETVQKLKNQHNTDLIIADYFMTASELGFELNDVTSLKVLSHKKNIKHGREKQLELMNLLLIEPNNLKQTALLVIEDSTIKLKNRAKYYSKLCQQFDSLKYLKTVNNSKSAKQHHIFLVNAQVGCDIPPIFYINHKLESSNLVISGWVIYHQVGIKELYLELNNELQKIRNYQLKNTNIKSQFKEINDPFAPNNGFQIRVHLPLVKSLRIKAIGEDGKEFYSPIYYLN
jgi:hypothetical protein